MLPSFSISQITIILETGPSQVSPFLVLHQQEMEPVALATAPPSQHQHHDGPRARELCRISKLPARRAACLVITQDRFANTIRSSHWAQPGSRGQQTATAEKTEWQTAVNGCKLCSYVHVTPGGRQWGEHPGEIHTHKHTGWTGCPRDCREEVEGGGLSACVDHRKTPTVEDRNLWGIIDSNLPAIFGAVL